MTDNQRIYRHNSAKGWSSQDPRLFRAYQYDLGSNPKSESKQTRLACKWLNLANAYGAVPHSLYSDWMLKMHHVPNDVVDILRNCFKAFRMWFSTSEFETNFIELQTGIALGCMVSPILFVLAMQVKLQVSKQNVTVPELSHRIQMAPFKAFKDDATMATSPYEEAEGMLNRLDQLVSKCRIALETKKNSEPCP